MDEKIAISLKNVGKAYCFYDRPADRLKEVLFRRHLRREHWALSGVNVEIPTGETFGLVGENGAGKSTFLKLVAGTIKPSTGSIQLQGRVAALLELGAGFHPEETGRENVLMMGALNGVAADQIDDALAQFGDGDRRTAHRLGGNRFGHGGGFHEAGMAARAMLASVISPPGRPGPSMALIRPSRMTSTRSETRITSGNSEETTMTARPSRARRSIRS